MNKQARKFFVKWIEAKYSLGVDPKQDQHHYNIIREMDIFQAIKSVPNVWMVQGSYEIEYPNVPTTNWGGVADVVQPWGPTITFKFQTKTAQPYQYNGYTVTPDERGDPNTTKAVSDALMKSLGQYIHGQVGITYEDNGLYDVTITTKR